MTVADAFAGVSGAPTLSIPVNVALLVICWPCCTGVSVGNRIPTAIERERPAGRPENPLGLLSAIWKTTVSLRVAGS